MSDRYGQVRISKIQETKNELRRAIQSEGTRRIQAIWDRLEQWIDSPPMMPAPEKVRRHMGQIIAECDCSRPEECASAEECLAVRKEN